RAFTSRYGGANLQSHGVKDVALLAIGVVQQRDVRAAVRVVLDGCYLRGYADLVAPEIDLAILLLVAAAAMPNHDFALIIAAAGALFGFQQGLFRLLFGDVALVQDGDKPSRRRVRIEALQSHLYLFFVYYHSASPSF